MFAGSAAALRGWGHRAVMRRRHHRADPRHERIELLFKRAPVVGAHWASWGLLVDKWEGNPAPDLSQGGAGAAMRNQSIVARPLLRIVASRSTTRARKETCAPSRQISVRMISPG